MTTYIRKSLWSYFGRFEREISLIYSVILLMNYLKNVHLLVSGTINKILKERNVTEVKNCLTYSKDKKVFVLQSLMWTGDNLCISDTIISKNQTFEIVNKNVSIARRGSNSDKKLLGEYCKLLGNFFKENDWKNDDWSKYKI